MSRILHVRFGITTVALARALLVVLAVALPARAYPQERTTFTRHIAPILFAHCATCHRPGEVGGFSLLSFADARPRAAAIARAVRTRAMPPWQPDPIPGLAFVGDRHLTDADIRTVGQWAASGALEGNPSDLPVPPVFAEGWRLGEPDLVVTMAEPFVLPAGGPDLLRNFVIPLSLTRARFVRGLEFRPDNRTVVHHANIRVDPSRAGRALDAADSEPGFDGRLSGGAEFPDGQFLGWTPGQLPPLADGDTAWRLNANSDLVVQLHMRPGAERETVRVRIGLFFTDQAPQHTPVMVRLGRQNLDIPAGASDYRVEDSYRLPVNTQLLAIQPHAHYRAREVSASAVLPNGTVRQLLRIGRWDFDWQDQYRYVSPIALPAGTLLTMAYRFDNSQSNPRNPEFPPRRVRWGQNSSDEMGDVWFQLVAGNETDRRQLLADSGRKVLSEDAIGFETLLQVEPRSPRLHEAAAAIFLSLGQIERGVNHLDAALEIDPRSVEAHYNLATALTWQGRTGEAAAHLQAALDVLPTHVGAHVNLGAILRGRGDVTGATAHLRRALELEPGNAAAHTNLGGLLVQQGRVTDAVGEYRAALDTSASVLEALTELAWTLATSPSASIRKPGEAVRLGEQARDLTANRDVRALDALAAAYASAERYSDATRTLDAALTLIPGGTADAADTLRLLRDRRALYASRRPYRDPQRADR